MATFFARFTQNWASSGIVIDPTGAQANAGFAYLGSAPPTVEGFNAMFQWNDGKDNWLYNQIANTILGASGTVTETNLNALRDAINAKIAANSPAGLYLPLTGGTLAGPGTLTVAGTIKATSGRILSAAATNPSVAMSIATVNAGFWASGTQLNVGLTDVTGLPTTAWGNFNATGFNYTGTGWFSGQILTPQLVIGTPGGPASSFYLYNDGTTMLKSYISQYYDGFTIANGTRSWAYPGGAMTLSSAGVLTVGSSARVGGTGINYYANDAVHYVGFSWNGSNAILWVDGTNQGGLAIGTNYVLKAGDTMGGGLAANGLALTTAGGYIQTPGGASWMKDAIIQTSNVFSFTIATDSKEPRAYLSGQNIWAANQIQAGGVIVSNGNVQAGTTYVPDLYMHADGVATYFNFNATRYFNYERQTGKLVYWGNGGRAIEYQDGGALVMQTDQAWKPGTNYWSVSSDERMKNIKGNYTKGLAEILTLNPIVYTVSDRFGGFYDPPLPDIGDDVEAPAEYNNFQRYIDSQEEMIGMSAQEAELVMPEMVVKRQAKINGEVVDDFRGLNTHALQYAMINAFKEVNQRLLALEGGA
jgi:hypothetical protein